MFQILFSTQIQFNFGCCVRKIPETNELWLCPEKLYLSLQLTYTAYFIAPVKTARIINRTFEFQSNFHNITFATEVLQISQFRSRVKLITICYLALFQQSETSQTSQGWDNISEKDRKSMVLSGLVRPKYSTVCLRIPVPTFKWHDWEDFSCFPKLSGFDAITHTLVRKLKTWTDGGLTTFSRNGGNPVIVVG